jgi:hypothetical protein
MFHDRTAPRRALPALGLLTAAALAACAPVPQPGPVGQPASATPTDRLLAAIESEGCVLTSANAGAVLLRANLTQAEATQLIPPLVQQGRAEVAGQGSFRVLTDNCI